MNEAIQRQNQGILTSPKTADYNFNVGKMIAIKVTTLILVLNQSLLLSTLLTQNTLRCKKYKTFCPQQMESN